MKNNILKTIVKCIVGLSLSFVLIAGANKEVKADSFTVNSLDKAISLVYSTGQYDIFNPYACGFYFTGLDENGAFKFEAMSASQVQQAFTQASIMESLLTYEVTDLNIYNSYNLNPFPEWYGDLGDFVPYFE